MKSEFEVAMLYETHTEHPLDEEIFERLAEKNPGTSPDYWRGHYAGVTWAYKKILGLDEE